MQSLMRLSQWLCWKLEYVEGRSKPAKMPYSPVTGRRASTTNPEDWADYHHALNMAKMMGMNGIGFVFREEDPYFFIDIDNCLQPDNTWSPFALELCQKFAGCYVEVSQSGTGLHLISSYQNIPEGFDSLNDQSLGLEMYYRWRFVAMTTSGQGNVDQDCTPAIADTVAKYAKKKVKKDLINWTNKPREDWSGPDDDEELIRRALQSKSAESTFGNKASFKDLWEANAEVLAVNYGSDQPGQAFNHSAADMALCSHLAWWTGCNCERMDTLFRKSALMRDKWSKREDYRQNTIIQAVAACETVYRQKPTLTSELMRSVQPAPTIAPNVGVTPAYMNIVPGDHKNGHYGANHSTNAATFVQNFYPHNSLQFTQQSSYRFNGKVWEQVSEDELKHQLTLAMLASEPKADIINGTFKVMSYMFTRPGMIMGQWEGRDVSNLIVCQNGIVDLKSGQLEPHNPAFFTTGILPYSYDPTAKAPEWQAFLNSSLEHDDERIALLQEWMGYMLVNSYEFQKAMLMIGASRSGKGTIGKVLKDLVGSQAYAGITLEGLAADAVVETILDKTVLFIGDAHSVQGNDRGKIMDRFMSITGNDPLPVNRKYKGAWNGHIPGRITMAANNVPNFNDDSGAMANRLLILPFNKSFLGNEDPMLYSKLREELPGICNWALEGLNRLRQIGRFTDPVMSRIEREEIMTQQAPLSAFVRECCEICDDGRVFTSDVYNAYKMWRVQEGGNAMTRSTFTRALRSTLRGKVVKDGIRIGDHTGQGFIGMRLKEIQPLNNVVPFTATGTK